MGSEARARVPSEFVVQDPHIANPPTLLLAFEQLVKRTVERSGQNADPQLAVEVEIQAEGGQSAIPESSNVEMDIKELFEKVKKWVLYLEKSQKSKLPSSFRWFGRTENHCLASGMDDFPRHRILSESESNVDLLSWILFADQSLLEIDKRLNGETEFGAEMNQKVEWMKKRLNEHWDPEEKSFGDIGVIRLNEHRRESENESENKSENEVLGFEIHRGYVSILPFALMLLDVADPRIEFILNDIEDPEIVI